MSATPPGGEPVDTGRILAYVPDLMDRSKVAAAGGARVVFVPTPIQLAETVAAGDLVLVDLTRAGVLEALPVVVERASEGPRGRVIGFANHVERPTMEAAEAAGCHVVLARSAFFSRLPEWLDP